MYTADIRPVAVTARHVYIRKKNPRIQSLDFLDRARVAHSRVDDRKRFMLDAVQSAGGPKRTEPFRA